MKIEKSASIYFAFQGVAVLAWWILLLIKPNFRQLFQMGDNENILWAFWLPDLFLLVVGSLILSFLIAVGHKFMPVVLWFTVGAFSYTAFYCFSFALLTDTGWLGVVAMFPAMIVSGNFAIGLSSAFYEKMFRRSKDGKTAWLMAKTVMQIIVVWTLILVIFPLLIIQIEAKIGIPRFSFPFQTVIGILLFPFVSLIGLSSAYSMAKNGRGTPLPMDTASKLVVLGIYKYVRNPMAISGIGQGLLVGFILGSPLVLLYALLGAFIWQFIYRRLEEEDLLEKFGTEYEDYQRKVRCWVPRFKRID
jgi:protein-S-isoprenylcysteine O-methyltransferase Ste14